MSEPRRPARSWNSSSRRGKRRSTGALLLRLSLGVGFLVCAVGGALILSGRSSVPVFQSFQAAFPEDLLGPGSSKLLVKLEDPFSHAPISGVVHVFLQGRGGYRYELGSGPVKGTGTVPFTLPNVGISGWGMVARVEGARAVEEISVENVDVDVGDKVRMCTERYHYSAGEEVRFLGLARHNDSPPRAASGEPWVLRISSPAGDLLQTLMGTTGPGGTFQGSFTLPFSARPGYYAMDAKVGRNLLGCTEVKVPMEKGPFRIRPLLLHRAVAGSSFQGKMEISFLDGTPFSGARVRVVLVRGEKDLTEAPCALEGPGLYSFTIHLPSLEKGEVEPFPLHLEARVRPPEGREEIHLAFDKIFLYRSAYRILLEVPHRWVPGMPHRVRAALVDREDRTVSARLEVHHGEDGSLLARGDYPGKGSALLDLVFPEDCRSLLFLALDAGGKELSRREIRCKLPENKGQDFSLVLEKSVLRPGEPLRITVHDKRKEDRLWVDLLVEGMVEDVFPLDVKDGKGFMEIPSLKLPQAFFQVRVWRWQGDPPPNHQAACLAPGEGSFAGRAGLVPADGGVKVKTGLPGDGDLLFSAVSGRLDPYDLPGPERAVLGLLPGTFGFSDPDFHRLARAWRDGTPLPELREDLAPFLRDSWSEGNGPGRLVEARMEEQIGLVVLVAGVLVTLLGAALSWWAFSKEKSARSRREVRLMLVLLGLSLGSLYAQEPPEGNPQTQDDRTRQESAPPPEVSPYRLSPWAWRRSPPARNGPSLPGPFVPSLPGKQTLSFGGQRVGGGGLLLSWGEKTWGPALELRWPSAGPIWPGGEWRFPLWVRAAGSCPETLRPFFTGDSRPAGPPVKFRGKGTWHRMEVALTYRDVAAGRKIRILGPGRKSLLETPLPVYLPPKEEKGLSWSAPFGEGLERELSFGPGGLVAGGLQVLAFAHPLEMALEHLDETRGDPVRVGSLDQVLGRARTALAVLEALMHSKGFPSERKKAAAVKALGQGGRRDFPDFRGPCFPGEGPILPAPGEIERGLPGPQVALGESP